jgi:methionine synthase II (cobalamin-independent)
MISRSNRILVTHAGRLPRSESLKTLIFDRAAKRPYDPAQEHEWRVFEDVKLPDGAMLIPGVVGHATNFIEHPELVADRLERYAK